MIELVRHSLEGGASTRAATFAVLVVAILFSTTGELFLKVGMNKVGEIALGPSTMLRALTQPAIILGFTLFGIGALFWLWVLGRADLSWAYPMLALGYLLVVAESRFLLGETVSVQRWLGALVVIAGVIVMYWSAPDTQ